MRDEQNLHKQRLQLRQKPLAEAVDAVMVRMRSAGEVNHRDQLIGRAFDLPTGENARGIAVEQ